MVLEKVWVIYDGRGLSDTDEACVYEAFSSDEGDTEESVIACRDKDWNDGAIYSYDLDVDGKTLINQEFVK